MSLALLQSYTSEEEGLEDRFSSLSSSEDDDDDIPVASPSASDRDSTAREKDAPFDSSNALSNSSLPSAYAAFAEVLGPPEFLNNSVSEGDRKEAEKDGGRSGKGRTRREKRDLPPGAVMESKPQLVGIRDRVRSDMEAISTAVAEGKRMISASNPNPKDAADLLRMCLQCGVPKTYSHSRGVVCPVCGDRPPPDPSKETEKKKGSIIKEKEKSKRMKGQSSHATWKSETEMQLRQQYD
ncbi:hypothetical protein HPP92_005681 [Vanilla planifolia]|uniref:Uncharacterized protein n=1 Tax=Vanilla planifolia TaxID=51239 RepID=A0A835S023_VANPL|nr:hypothetical protein HPP92_005681 [Vanilla planifolia]